MFPSVSPQADAASSHGAETNKRAGSVTHVHVYDKTRRQVTDSGKAADDNDEAYGRCHIGTGAEAAAAAAERRRSRCFARAHANEEGGRKKKRGGLEEGEATRNLDRVTEESKRCSEGEPKPFR
ncbi:hypothetical protein Q5P01_003750 [Channa striata]|uniref:Uncharacterized protein n=1 Tax=Channa striata TaxID=64152 RepID=A0AA88NT01_CHASR|nr:hypothetical protein Q5P01_003750 [Channa striata]